jgi:hypothetical protein
MFARIAFVPSLLMIVLAGNVARGARAQEVLPPPKEVTPKADKDPKLDLVIPGQILMEDALDRGRSVPGKVHAVRFQKGQAYVIDLVAMNFDAFLRLEDSAGVQLAEDDDGGGMLNSRIRYTAAKDDTYLIYATSLGGGEGDYTLSVKSFVAVPVKLIAMAAPAANKPSEIKGQLNANDPADAARNQPAKVHTVDLKGGKTYIIDMMSQQFDSYLVLQDANGVRLAQDDDGGEGLNSRIQYQPKADGRFRLVATTFNGQLGEFTLKVSERP